MAAAKHNLIVSRGEDFSFTLTVSDGATDPILTNDTFKAEIRRASGKPLVASFTYDTTNSALEDNQVLLFLDNLHD